MRVEVAALPMEESSVEAVVTCLAGEGGGGIIMREDN